MGWGWLDLRGRLHVNGPGGVYRCERHLATAPCPNPRYDRRLVRGLHEHVQRPQQRFRPRPPLTHAYFVAHELTR